MGIALCSLCLANPQLRGYGKAGLWKRIRMVQKSDPIRFWKTTAYMLVYTGLIEELIFRWFFVGTLQPYVGWWVLLAEPFICTLWHYPVIISQPWMYTDDKKLNWHGLLGWSSQAFVIGFLLTIVSVTTHNISGAVVAHSFSNWLSIVNEQQ
jgi:membrane protease YdiL (CAAX protease family)